VTREVIQSIKKIIRAKLQVATFFRRYRKYLKTGEVRPGDARLLRDAAFLTNGKALDEAVTKFGKFLVPRKVVEMGNSIIDVDAIEISEAIESIKSYGYWIAPRTIGKEELDKFEKNAEIEARTLFGFNKNEEAPIEDLHKNSTLKEKEMVFLGSDWVLSQDLTYRMATCKNILNIVSGYLGFTPILNLPESWFSFPVANISAMSAQNWHFDCDRVRWIKVFVYLTDVDLDSGPHSFVATSHIDWRQETGSSRFSEQQVKEKFSESEIKNFTAKRGTVIFEDTRGLHKGTPLVKGHRLMLQLEFSLDSFGYRHPIFNIPADYDRHAENYSYLFPRDRYSRER